MSPFTRSLLALAVVALLHSACAAPEPAIDDSQCTTVMHGSTQGMRTPATTYISAGEQDASLDVEDICWTRVIGEEVRVCDDVPPTVFVPELPLISPVVVHRNGNYYSQRAEVTVTLWCEIRN